MSQDAVERLVTKLTLVPVERVCSWCGSAVPLQANELVGVCIGCGMLVFRNEADSGLAPRHRASRCHEELPTTA